MVKKTIKKKQPIYDQVVCCFQGGGALGAYQVGVLRALDEAGYYPDWFVGTSIGAINAAIAAGNPEKIRIEKMYGFWEKIATPEIFSSTFLSDDLESRKLEHFLSAQSALLFGQPGFFTPRFPPPLSGIINEPDKLSYYDTSELKTTLEEFIDFDRINSTYTRLSVGAVEVCSGEIDYFDSLTHKIGPEHIMASAALPPGFPAIEIEGQYYWDGGISSNSPTTYVLSTDNGPKNILCFAIHLFDSFGLNPKTIDEVNLRKKDITFSSHFCKMITLYKQIHELKNSIHLLSQYVLKQEKNNPELKLCIARGCETNISLVRFLYENDESEFDSKDYEFSKKTLSERIEHGYAHGKKAVRKSPWHKSIATTTGLAVYDMASNQHLKDAENE